MPTPPSPRAAPAGPSAIVHTQPSARAMQLGYLGLLPFVLCALLAWLVREDVHPYVVDAMSKYGAVIVSFLGGLHWGVAMRGGQQHGQTDARLAWAVVPPLVAWIAAIMPAYAGLVVLGVLLVVCYLVDRRAYPHFGLEGWLTLRFRLTAIAALSCFIAAAGS